MVLSAHPARVCFPSFSSLERAEWQPSISLSRPWVLVRDFFPEFFPLLLTAESRFFSVGVDVQCAELTPGILFPILSRVFFCRFASDHCSRKCLYGPFEGEFLLLEVGIVLEPLD
jgi:hypothetical protein